MFLRAPAGWSSFTVAVIAMIVLAGLDLAGAYAAKEAVARRSPGFAVLGVTLFALLFWVYASSLQYAELAPVTLGWIVVLQVGVVLLDRFYYGQAVPRGHWLAIVVIVAAQAYLLLAPTPAPASEATPEPRPAATQAGAVPRPREHTAVDLDLDLDADLDAAHRTAAAGRHRA